MNTETKYTAGMGKRIRDVRQSADVGQVDFAEQLGVTRQSISGYERGRLRPSFKVIDKICALYDVYPWWLIYGIVAPGPLAEFHEGTRAIGSEPEPQLSNTQRALIDYVRMNRDAAEKLGHLLWDKALDV